MRLSGEALGVIDAQRGFYPAAEGQRLGLDGFGELPVEHAEVINPELNKLLGYYAARGFEIFTTQDWHPIDTAHFDEKPNFQTTWPRHCVANTAGAFFHPDLAIPLSSEHFYKGKENLTRGEDDTSYSGANGKNTSGIKLIDWLRKNEVQRVALGGLTYDYCVKATAVDLCKAGFNVVVLSDATAAVSSESRKLAFEAMHEAGVNFDTPDHHLNVLRNTVKG
jgi:nicotinamidase/pyrazinamidase